MDPYARFPETIPVPLGELHWLVVSLEALLDRLERTAPREAHRVERLLARVARWVWPLLGELDREDA